MEHFRTTRLTARDWTVADAQAAFGIYGRDGVLRWLGARPRRAVPSLGQMRERLDLMIERGRDEPAFGLWAVELRTDAEAGVVVGAVLLSRLPGDDGEVEIGWHLNPDHWGLGYATEAGRGVIGLAFGLERVGTEGVELSNAARSQHASLNGRSDRAPLDRVIALVDPDNARSQAVCRRLGMRHVGQTDKYYGLALELFRAFARGRRSPAVISLEWRNNRSGWRLMPLARAHAVVLARHWRM